MPPRGRHHRAIHACPLYSTPPSGNHGKAACLLTHSSGGTKPATAAAIPLQIPPSSTSPSPSAFSLRFTTRRLVAPRAPRRAEDVRHAETPLRGRHHRASTPRSHPRTLSMLYTALWQLRSRNLLSYAFTWRAHSPRRTATTPLLQPSLLASVAVHHGMTTDASRTCQLPRTHGKPQSGREQRAMWWMGCACAQAYLDTQPNLVSRNES